MIEVVPHDPSWADAFRTEAALLSRVLAPWLAGGVEHIGSTSVPGLAAKPVLDLMAGVVSLAAARDALPLLVEQGYEVGTHRPAEAHWLRRVTDGRTTHALHLTEVGSDLWRERLAFRDALRASPELVEEYAALKLRLAAVHDDVQAYTGDKRTFVAGVVEAAGVTLTDWRGR